MSEELTGMKQRKGLGRGLSSLLGEDVPDVGEGADPRSPVEVPIGHLESGRFQPRMEFEPEALQDLCDSIREKGVLQPILVRRLPEDSNRFEIIAGERRWRASQMAQLHSVPVLIRAFSDQEAAEVALIENLQRRDLSALEEAEGYKRLMDEFSRTQDDLSKALGKSRSHVANMVRLLALPDPVKGMLRSGSLSTGHARALLNAEDPVHLAEVVVKKGLNVRQTEKLATERGGVKARKPRPATSAVDKDADTVALERDLSNLLGLRVQIDFRGRGGAVVLHYETLEQLDDILYRLNNPTDNAADARRRGAEDGEDIADRTFASAIVGHEVDDEDEDEDGDDDAGLTAPPVEESESGLDFADEGEGPESPAFPDLSEIPDVSDIVEDPDGSSMADAVAALAADTDYVSDLLAVSDEDEDGEDWPQSGSGGR
ncbi:MAG: ParB/RepB/Spo0J family partition protein [Rhodospirillaceae bacterium]